MATAEDRHEQAESGFERMRDGLRKLYHGSSPSALRFQLTVIILDVAIIAFFVLTPVLSERPSFLWLDYSVAALLAADIAARALASNVAMIVGISLFVKLAQSIFRPSKVFFPCPQCALQRHEPDAVHCKACGHVLKIPDDGA